MANPNNNATLLITLEAQSQKMQSQLVAVTKQIDRFAANTERRFDQMNARNAESFAKLGAQASGAFGKIGEGLAALGLSAGIKQVLDYASAWQEAQNKLNAASSFSGLQARSLTDLADAAMAARAPLSDYVDLYARMLRIAPGVHATELQIASATDIVAKAFKAGGASAAEQANGITQLGQALGAGLLQGQDLRALKEDAPVLSQAIASYMRTTVGGLRQLGEQGKISSEDAFRAILAGGNRIAAAFKTTTATLSDAVGNIGTAFMAYVGTEGQASGATQKLVDALTYLADNFGKAAPIVTDFVAIIGGALAAKAIVGFGGALGEATLALGTFLSTAMAGELTMAGLSAAMGPIALLAGAAAAAIIVFGNSAGDVDTSLKILNSDIQTNAEKLGIAKNASAEYRYALQQQIGTQIQAAQAALQEAKAQLEAAKSRGTAMGIFGAAVGVVGEVVAGKGYQLPSYLDPDGLYNSQVGPAEASVDAAQKALDTLKGQQNTLSWQELMPPGTSDQAGGTGANGTTGKPSTAPQAYTNARDSIQKQTDATNAQTAAQAKLNPLINDFGYAATKAKTASDLLSAAQKAGIPITQDLKDNVNTLAENYAQAGVAAQKLANDQDQLRAKAEGFRDAAKDGMKTFIDDLVQGKSAVEALGDALSNVGNYLEQMGLDALFGGGTYGNKNQSYGLLGTLFNLNAKGGIASHGRPMPVFAAGGVSKQASIFGEAGPEAAVPLPDGRRIPVDLRMPSRTSDNSPRVTYAPTIDARGADSAAVAKLAALMAKERASFEANVVGVLRKARNGHYRY